MKVDVDPYRQAFEQSGISKAELARRMGMLDSANGNKGDTSRVNRMLGYKEHTGTGADGPWKGFTKTIRTSTAERICKALGLDPWELGL